TAGTSLAKPGSAGLDDRLSVVSGSRGQCVSVLPWLEPYGGISRNRAAHGGMARLGLGRWLVFQLHLYDRLGGGCLLVVARRGRVSSPGGLDRRFGAWFLRLHGLQRHRRLRTRAVALAGTGNVSWLGGSVGGDRSETRGNELKLALHFPITN